MNELVFVNGMKPGHGINVLSGANLPNIAVLGSLTAIAVAKGQGITRQIIRIDDVSSLHKSLGVDVSASGFYCGYSANAKMDFADSCNVNSHSTYLMVHVEVKNSALSMDDPVLTSDASDLLKAKQPDRFRARFGDIFVNGLNTGGEYFALYEISGTDEAEKESLSIDVNASFQGFMTSAALGVKIRSMTESSHSHLDVNVFTFQLGGAKTSGDDTPEEIMAKARDFASSVSGDFSVPYSVLPASYTALKLPDDGSDPIDVEFQKQALADAFKQRTDMMSINNDIEYILLSNARGFNEFEPFDVVELTDARNQLATQLDTNFRTASMCMRDAKQCKFTVFDLSKIHLPARKPGVVAPKPVPNFVGMTATQAFALADILRITLDEHQPSGPLDDTGGMSLEFLELGNSDPGGGGSPGRPHTNDQIVVIHQQPGPSVLTPGMVISLSFDLAPGVPQ